MSNVIRRIEDYSKSLQETRTMEIAENRCIVFLLIAMGQMSLQNISLLVKNKTGLRTQAITNLNF